MKELVDFHRKKENTKVNKIIMLQVTTFFKVIGVIFFLVGAIHLVRLITGFQIIIGDWQLPVWLSLFGTLIPWYLAYNAFKFAGKKKNKK